MYFNRNDSRFFFIRDPSIKKESRIYQSSNLPDKNGNLSKSLCLLRSKYLTDLFSIIPRTFTITTKNKISFDFNIEMLKETSDTISDFLEDNPDHLQYHLEINDDQNILEKFSKMYQGEEVYFTESDLDISRGIISLLQMQQSICPSDFEIIIGKKGMKYGLNIHRFVTFLKNSSKKFIIKTNKKEYECNILAVNSSNVLRSLLEKDPKIECFNYDYEDELDEFQLVCDILNFKEVSINSSNMHSLQEIINDLQITVLIDKVDKFIEDFDKITQKINDEFSIVDSIEEVFGWLYQIKVLGVEAVKNFIIESKWIQSDEDVQELVAFLLQVINSDSIYHRYLIELIILLDKEANENNSLKILIPFLVSKLMNSFGASLLNCSFVYNLYKNGFIQRVELNNRIIQFFNKLEQYKEKKKKGYSYYGYYERGNVSVEASNIICWFYPELIEVVENVENVIEPYLKTNQIINFYFPNNIEGYQKMRDSGEPDDELTKSLRNDDIDTFQSIVIQNDLLNENEGKKNRPGSYYYYPNQKKISSATVPFNIFENFVPNGTTNYINYACAYGSLKCFKYLLLNHEKVTKSTFDFAVFGGNVEIIKIVDQNIKKDIHGVHNGSNYYNYYDYNSDSEDLRFPAIIKHQNDVFDWILQEKYKNDKSIDNDIYRLLLCSARNCNAHSLVELIEKRHCIVHRLVDMALEASKKGFYHLSKLIINLLISKKEKIYLDFQSSVSFGNLSIFKFYCETINEKFNLKSALSLAIECNYINIIHYFFEELIKSDFEITQDIVYECLKSAISIQNDDIFNYLINQFRMNNQAFFHDFRKQKELFNISCSIGTDREIKTLTNLIIENNEKYDFTVAFFNAALSNKYEICKYFIDKKLFINYEKLSSQVTKLSTVTEKIFSLIIENADDESRETFLSTFSDQCVDIKNNELIKYLIKKGASCESYLYNAVNSHNIDLIRFILEKDPSCVNKRLEKGTILFYAVQSNDIELVIYLLSIPGINPSLYGSNGSTPLILAVYNSNFGIVNEILNFYGDNTQSEIDQFNEAFKTCLKSISQKDATYTYNSWTLRQKKASSNTSSSSKEKSNMINILKRLLKIKTIDPNSRLNNNTLLTYACEINDIEIVKLLLELDKIDVNLCTLTNGNSPLMISINKNNLEIAELLIKDPRTNININNFTEHSALTISVSNNLDNIVDLLINDERFDPIESHISYAFFISSESISKKLISSKSLDVNYHNVVDSEKKIKESQVSSYEYRAYIESGLKYSLPNESKLYITTLSKAIANNFVEKVDLIINHPSFDSVKSQLKKSIFSSVKHCAVEIFKKLIRLINNDVNIFNCNGESLLFVAVANQSIDIVSEILKSSNFDANKSCLFDAFMEIIVHNNKKSIEMMNLLYDYDKENKHLIDFNKMLPNGRSFYTLIASEKLFENEFDFVDDIDYVKDKDLSGIGEIVSFFLDHGVDPNKPDDDGFLPLEYAILLNSYDFTHVLIDSNRIDYSQKVQIKYSFFRIYENQSHESFDQMDSKWTTYLHLAARVKNSEIFKEFIDKKLIDVNSPDELGETALMEACKFVELDNIFLLEQVDDLDYKQKTNQGKDCIELFSYLAEFQEEIPELKTKDDYFKGLIKIINIIKPLNDRDQEQNDLEFTEFLEQQDEYVYVDPLI